MIDFVSACGWVCTAVSTAIRGRVARRSAPRSSRLHSSAGGTPHSIALSGIDPDSASGYDTFIIVMNMQLSDLSHTRKIGVLAICSLSLLIVGLDVTIVNVALPSIGKDLDAGVSELQWTVDAYTL